MLGEGWQGRVFWNLSIHITCLGYGWLFLFASYEKSKLPPESAHQEINNHKKQACRWCADKCFMTNGLPWRKKLSLLCALCRFPWYKSSRHSQCPANNLKSLKLDLGRDGTPGRLQRSELAPAHCRCRPHAKNSVERFTFCLFYLTATQKTDLLVLYRRWGNKLR